MILVKRYLGEGYEELRIEVVIVQIKGAWRICIFIVLRNTRFDVFSLIEILC